MKLRFLGQAYSTFDNSVETIPLGNTARFLGQNYTLRRPTQKVISQSFAKKYRGVTYDA